MNNLTALRCFQKLFVVLLVSAYQIRNYSNSSSNPLVIFEITGLSLWTRLVLIFPTAGIPLGYGMDDRGSRVRFPQGHLYLYRYVQLETLNSVFIYLYWAALLKVAINLNLNRNLEAYKPETVSTRPLIGKSCFF